MSKILGWLRPDRRFFISFLLVVLPPAATLVGLGVLLLEQDRALVRQRQAELLDHAADNGVHALGQELALTARLLAGPAWMLAEVPPDSVYVVLSPDRILATPPGRLPYFPAGLTLKEPPAKPFLELEAQEFGAQNPAKALEMAGTLAASPDPVLRAGALLRQARLLRKLNRPGDALQAYELLSRIPAVANDGVPVDLVARKARCSIFEEQSRRVELLREASALENDLRSGKWQLDQPSFEQVAGQLSRWLGAEFSTDPAEDALATGVGWLYQRWTSTLGDKPDSAGSKLIMAGDAPVTILWASQPDRLAALVAGPSCLRDRWLAQVQKAVKPAQASLTAAGGKRLAGDTVPADLPRVTRFAADTGLPWSVMVARGVGTSAEFDSRRRILLAGLAAVLALVAAGSYFIWRAFNREMAVARLQSDFVAAVSHEFRTPLTTLRQFNDLLADDGKLPPEKRRSFHAAQTRATERLHRLVESLLDFGRMEAGRRPYQFQRLDAGELVKDVADEFRAEVSARGFSVQCDLDAAAHPVDADPEALARAVHNLLDNAAKYSGTGRSITVTVRRSGGSVLIAVRDQGIGIPAAEQKRIFRKFVRGAAAGAQGVPGTGIGLAMVRHIVEAHGGSVGVASAPGEGSTFTITIPARSAGGSPNAA
jgi:two-component system phosphate regulon sensor histidine kinase PhoR